MAEDRHPEPRVGARWWGSRGASLIEYALLFALIILVAFVAVTYLGEETTARLDSVGSSVGIPG